MTATVLPYPLAKRRAYVRRQAAQLARCSAPGAAAYLRNQMAVQRESLLNKGCAPADVESAVHEAEAAIRREAFRLVKTGGAA
jgi:hypothetical protein